MATKQLFLRHKAISLVNQKIDLLQSFPDASCYINKDALHWSGVLCPSPLSRRYRVEMVYKPIKSPRIYVYDERISTMDISKIPHHFEIDKDSGKIALCLYTNGEFTPHKWLSKTIIPWAVEWLFHYEIWLSTGNWYGGGKHPNTGSRKKLDKLMEELERTDPHNRKIDISTYSDATKAC